MTRHDFKQYTMHHIVCSVLFCLGSIAIPVCAAQDGRTHEIDFAREILPVLSDKCFVCHGPDGRENHILRLDSKTAATRDLGGHRAIDVEEPDNSEILARIFSVEDPMPPQDAEKQLTNSEHNLLARWIQQGGHYAVHWSFVPPQKLPPAGNNSATKGDVIDAFVGAQLREKGSNFAPMADRATLARRVGLVLTGLPPEPAQLAEFLADDRSDAYERLAEQLLNSPRYGEHQARYWLDAIRYGDTHGLHLDNRRAIYPYRDWIIHAINKNLPLDDLITWQLAGDLLPNPTLEQRVATGFVRMNPSTSEGGAIVEEFQAKNNFDRVETLGTVFLGMSLTCARCHTHKYDPISQTEYYRLLAFFNSTAEHALDGNKYVYKPTLKAPASVAAWDQWSNLTTARENLLATVELQSLDSLGTDSRTLEVWKQSNASERLTMVADPKGVFATSGFHQIAITLSKRMVELAKSFQVTLVAEDLVEARTTRLLERGEYDRPVGEAIEPGVITAMSMFPKDAPRNRLGLSQWLISRKHPLVARVLVNRIWQRTFGAGLVRTPEDFGLQGQQPTHPKLLDWLAVELHDSGWDLKHMLRLIVTTKTFRQQSAWRADVEDPENRLLARGPRHRLDAEVIRDIALWASGLLDDQMGGEGVKPYQPNGLWAALMHPSSNTRQYVRDTGLPLYRRSLYVYWKRTCPHPMLTLFDAPSRESSCVRRSRTNTSLQSLGLLNETQRIELSRVLSQRLLQEASDDTARLNLLFTLLSCRTPNDFERSVCTKLLETMRLRYRNAEHDAQALLLIGDTPRNEQFDVAEQAAWTQLAVTVMASDVAIMLY